MRQAEIYSRLAVYWAWPGLLGAANGMKIA